MAPLPIAGEHLGIRFFQKVLRFAKLSVLGKALGQIRPGVDTVLAKLLGIAVAVGLQCSFVVRNGT